MNCRNVNLSVEWFRVDRIRRSIGLDEGNFCEPEASFLWDQSPDEIQEVQETTLHKIFPSTNFKNIHK